MIFLNQSNNFPTNEILCPPVIKSCRAIFGVKWRVFFSTSILCKNANFGKKIEISWEMLTFSNNCALLLKVNFLLENMFIVLRSNLVVSFEKKWQFVLCQLFRYVCFTSKSENRAETPVLKDIFIFLANGHCFQKL